MKKAYKMYLEGVETIEEMNDLLMEANYCEFCNNGSFVLTCTNITYDKDSNETFAIVVAEGAECDFDKMVEFLSCEFCHSEHQYMSIEELGFCPKGYPMGECRGEVSSQCEYSALKDGLCGAECLECGGDVLADEKCYICNCGKEIEYK